jgi:hypothetical protein
MRIFGVLLCSMSTLLFLLTGCVSESKDRINPFTHTAYEFRKIQVPIVTVDQEKIPVMRGTQRPPEVYNTVDPVIVSPGSTLRIDFKYEPKFKPIRVQQWAGVQSTWSELSPNNELTLPENPGVYVYIFHIYWVERDEAEGTFTTVVEVQ